MIKVFVVFMTALLPISIYRTIKEFKNKQEMKVVFWGKEKHYTGTKAKRVLVCKYCLSGVFLNWPLLAFEGLS